MKNIVLVGFMGTGKTEVGKIVAQRLQRQRLCLDDMIEWKVGKPVVRIFKEDGEPYFRKIEAEVVREASKDKNVVLDAGGGVVIDENNVKYLKEHGILICLMARAEVIYQRTKGHLHRPLLNTPDPVASIDKLMKEREEYYNRADYKIDTSDVPLEEVADKVIEIYEHHEPENRTHMVLT
ncbi:MAG: shikimate kinase [Candidatus Omnitrophica bacterium]|nr:shikimate kinase [Candidatus Omnitrophota bacterium]